LRPTQFRCVRPVFDAAVIQGRSWFEPACRVTSMMCRAGELFAEMVTSLLVAGIANGSIGGQALELCY
jgi:hypothetical protein